MRSVAVTALCTSFLIHLHNTFTHVQISVAAHYLRVVDPTGIIVDARNLVAAQRRVPISIQFLNIHHTCVICFGICGSLINTGGERRTRSSVGDSALRADATAAGGGRLDRVSVGTGILNSQLN